MTKTNYNERLDEILGHLNYETLFNEMPDGRRIYEHHKISESRNDEAKSALTQLFKDLVAEAKPDFDEVDDYNRTFLEAMFKVFEQNLLKLLENK